MYIQSMRESPGKQEVGLETNSTEAAMPESESEPRAQNAYSPIIIITAGCSETEFMCWLRVLRLLK